MSENNNIFENDLLMRAILENGQEEVPARVWDAVSKDLDKAAGKTAVLRWHRVAVSMTAVAAAVAAVLVLDRPESADLVPAVPIQSDMIAVVEPEMVETEEMSEKQIPETVSQTSVARLMAYVPESGTGTEVQDDTQKNAAGISGHASDIIMNEVSDIVTGEKRTAGEGEKSVQAEPKEYFPTVWEEEKPSHKVRTSIVVSGITGASGSQNNTAASGIQKAPALVMTPAETGIKEKNIPSKHGLPVSVGAGLKIEFTPKWSLGVGLNYTYLNRTFNGTYTHVSESGVIDNLVTSDIRNTQHYIGVPVNSYYNIVNNRLVNFYAYAGGTVEKCVADKYLILSSSISHKEPAKGVQLSANLGIGAEFMLGKHIGLYLDPSLRYYFDCNQPKSIRTEQPLMLGFELGFRFRL